VGIGILGVQTLAKHLLAVLVWVWCGDGMGMVVILIATSMEDTPLQLFILRACDAPRSVCGSIHEDRFR
jgi:hypothetical protein